MNGLGQIRRVLAHRDFRFLWLAQCGQVARFEEPLPELAHHGP